MKTQNSTFACRSIVVLSLSIGLSSVACKNHAESTASNPKERTAQSAPLPQQGIPTVESKIRDDDLLLWKSRERLLPNQESLTGIQFFDQNNGWIATHEGSVYRTTDGGNRWQRIKPPIPNEAYISSFFFTNISDGWIACGLKSSDVLEPRGNKVWLFRTKDSGRTWTLQYQNEAVQLLRVRFANEQEGWAVGTQFVMRDTLQTVPFLIRTIDEGANWINLSGNLSITRPGNGFTDVYADSSSDATLLAWNGDIFRTVNGGQDWQQVAVLHNEPEQTYMGHLVKLSNGGGMLAAGGADSLEGFWGVLTRRDPDGRVKQYRVNCYISDLVAISDTTLLISGHIILPASRFTTAQRQGVILHSSDGGQTWSTVYRSAVSSLNALAVSDACTVWAVGENGLVLNLNIP